MSAKARISTRQPPRSMILLRRAADAAGYAVAPAIDEEPAARSAGRSPAPALVLASIVCLAGIAFAVY